MRRTAACPGRRGAPALLGRWRPDGVVPVAQWQNADPEPVPGAFWGTVDVKE